MKFFFALTVWFLSVQLFAQEVQQTVSGVVADAITGQSLAGASIRFVGVDFESGTSTDSSGYFNFQVKLGRYVVTVSHVGFRSWQTELKVISGKETNLSIELEELPKQLDEVEITSGNFDAPGYYTFTIEKTLRIPANFFDPVRLMNSYPGITTASDQNNGIIIKGNSPAGLLWRLNGLDIVNPNHLSNAGTFSDKPAVNGGGVSIVSAQVLESSEFYTGSIPVQYGNLLSGAINMNLRDGNFNNTEYTTQLSLIGLDVATEGPIKKDRSSYLVNYRYSTVGLLSQAGVDFGDEEINFHDVTFNLAFKGKRNQKLNVFGFAGASKNVFEAKEFEDREEDKDWYDIDYKARTFATGLTYNTSIGAKTSFCGGLSYSASVQFRDAYFNEQSTRYYQDEFYSTKSIASLTAQLVRKTKGVEFSYGVNASYQADTLYNRSLPLEYIFDPCINCNAETIAEETGFLLLQPYVDWKFFLLQHIQLEFGARYVYYTDIDYHFMEPRIKLTYFLNANSNLDLACDITHQQVATVFRTYAEFEPTRMSRYSLLYQNQLSEFIKLKAEVYHQDLRNLLVDPNSTFSSYNYFDGPLPLNLEAKGTAENYGLNVSVEKSFSKRNYFIAGGSYYESKFKDYDGREYDSRFNGNFSVNATYGREWSKSSKNRFTSLNFRALYLGGLRSMPINESASTLAYQTVYDYSRGFSEQLGDYLRLDLSISWVKNKPKYTRTLSIDIQNLFGIENDAYRYYDFTQQKVILKKQLGIIPILIYRIDF